MLIYNCRFALLEVPITQPLRLLAVLAHPDDESLGFGGTLVRYADEGVQTHLVCATRGERGRFFDNEDRPSLEEVGRVREQELQAAAKELKLQSVTHLDYIDGDLDQVDYREAVARIVRAIRKIRPQVVMTFPADGAYGHPDHIAISQLAGAACVAAADVSYAPDQGEAHRVSKLYWIAWPKAQWDTYQATFKKLTTTIDGVERQATPWPEWALTTLIDSEPHWRTVWRAILCHKTQLSIYGKLGSLSEEQHRLLWGRQYFYRVYSLFNGGRKRETDLFEGIRD